MVPTALISSEEHFTLILVVASRKVYEYKRKYLCHFFFIKHSPALGWKIIKCKTMEINKRGLNIWIFNWWSASRPDAPHHIKTYIKLLEGRAAMRKIFEFVSVLLSLSVIWQAIWLPTGRRWFNYIQELYQYALNENTLRVINCTYALRLKNKTPYGLVTILGTCPGPLSLVSITRQDCVIYQQTPLGTSKPTISIFWFNTSYIISYLHKKKVIYTSINLMCL